MDQGPSRTALLVAVGRGLHRQQGASPWVFDDAYALPLAGPSWPEVEQVMRAVIPAPLFGAAGASLLARARYAEDRLLAGDFRQYVVLGAGLDSFAWRRPDLLADTVVFEVDHPDSQAYKRGRCAELALPEHDNHRYVALDFESQTLAEALDGSGFDWTAPTLFSWLGVTLYLTSEAIAATLQTVAKCGAGSEIVFTYYRPEGQRDELSDEFCEIFGSIAAASGEPFETFLTAGDVEQLVASCGLRVAEHPTHKELCASYFAGRDDGLVPLDAECVITAAV